MTQPRLNHTQLAYIHSERTDNIRDEDIANDFILTNEKRKRYFKTFTQSLKNPVNFNTFIYLQRFTEILPCSYVPV